MRLVCKAFGRALQRVVFRTLEIHFVDWDRCGVLLDKLQMIADGEWPQAAYSTHVLVLRSLYALHSRQSGDCENVEARTKELLPVVIAKLKAVHTVECVGDSSFLLMTSISLTVSL